MKKSIKSEKPAAPQVKKSASVKKAVGTKKAATKTAAPPAPPAVVSTAPVVKKKTAIKNTVAAKASVKPVAPAAKVAPAATVITAKVDIGFGNTLYLRGEGADLSWDSGLPLNCVADDQWSITLTGASAPIVFKFLVNDLTWSVGEDFVVEPGSTVVLEPAF